MSSASAQHAGLNCWTSCGYAPTRAEIRAMLQRAFGSLLPRSLFALDTMNLAGVLRHFREIVTVERDTPLGLITMTPRSRVDLAAGRTRFSVDFRVVDTVDAVDTKAGRGA